jgi:hypothetical protein
MITAVHARTSQAARRDERDRPGGGRDRHGKDQRPAGDELPGSAHPAARRALPRSLACFDTDHSFSRFARGTRT